MDVHIDWVREAGIIEGTLYQWPIYQSVITVRVVRAHIVGMITLKDQESEKVHTLRS